MKKILTILLVLVLALTGMVSCDMLPDFGLSNEDLGLPSVNGEKPTVEEAKNYLFQTYKDAKTETPTDYDVVSVVIIKGVTFNVTWTSDNAKVVVAESSKDKHVKIDVPAANEEAFTYKLTATVSLDGESAAVEFTRTVPVIKENTNVAVGPQVGTAYNLAYAHGGMENDVYYITGFMSGYYMATSTDVNEAVNVYVEQTTGGYYMYCISYGEKLYIDMYANGNYVNAQFAKTPGVVYTYNEELSTFVATVTGQDYMLGVKRAANDEGKYYTTIGPVNPNQSADYYWLNFYESTIPDQEPAPYTTPEEIVNAAYALAQDTTLEGGNYTLTGVITEVKDAYSSQYKNVTVVIQVGNMSDKLITCYRIKGTGADQIGVGDTITVKGVIKNYKGTVEFDAGSVILSWEDTGNGTTVDPQPPVPSVELDVVDPVVGTAYKFGMVQGKLNDGKVYFLDGTMNGFYMNTTTDATKAVDVYLEAADNGYYLYAIVGEAKQYINFVSATGTDGKTHINAKYEATPSTVYTYNTEKKTVTTLIDGEEYWLGTRNDNTYTTVGPVKVSYNGFYNQFYAEAVAHEHSYEAVVTAPTCTVAGYTTHTCECGDSYTDTPVDALGHNYENGVCTNCGLAEAHTHKHEAVVTAPTCTEAGYTTYTCACGDSYTADPVDALGHTGGAAATCEAAQTCTVCGAEIAPKLDHTYVDGACSACGAKDPDYYFEMTIAEALAAADDTKVIVSGTVCAINTAWSDSYGNISVTITDADGNTLYLYRLKTNVALGDIITAKGTMDTYNSNRQMAQGGTAEITGHDSGYDYAEMTIAEAIKVADNTNVIVTGTVVKINTAYSEQYGNISVTIADENGNQLYLYRLTGNVALNDVIKVKGAMATHNGSRQVAGGTFEKVGTHTCSNYTEATCGAAAACVVCGATTGEPTGLHTYADATCTAPKTCTECGATEGEPAGHTYVNGVCSGCGKEEGTAEPVTASKTMAELITSEGWTSSTTKQSFELDEVVSVKIDGGSNTGKAYNGDHIRIYATDTPAGTITITLAEGYELVSVTVSAQTGTYAFLYVDGGSTDISNVETAVSGSSVVLTSVKNGSNGKQVRVTAIEVVYKAVA